jgi:small conductance mechanosensitive channel
MTPDLDTLGQAKGTLVDLAIRFGPKLLVAALILVAGTFTANWIGRSAARGLNRWDLEPPVRLLLTRIARVLVLLLFAIMALQNLGIELLPLIAGLGVIGAGVALATQGVLSNMIAGLTIIFTKPYRVGEYIAIVSVEGTVEMITLFSTFLTHADHSRIVVPNRKVVGEILHNYGRIRQTELQVRVPYDADLPLVLGTIRDLVAANPRVLKDPPALIQVDALAETAVQIGVKPWVTVADYGSVEGELNLAIVAALRAQAIAVPYPQHAVRLIGAAASG